MDIEEPSDDDKTEKTVWVGPMQGSWLKSKIAKKVFQIGRNTRLWQVLYFGNRLLNWSLKIRIRNRDFDVIEEGSSEER